MRRQFGIGRTLAAVVAFFGGALLAYASLHSYVPGDLLPVAADAEGAPEHVESASGPVVEMVGYSDVLDKQNFEGTKVGGLSALTYDPRRDLYYALVDREQGIPAQFYAIRLPVAETSLGAPTVFERTLLRDAEGSPFTASKFDGEGIAFAPWGDLFVASETEPSIRTFSLEGRLLQGHHVPVRFLVAPEGHSQPNGAFEGLSLSPSGDTLFVAPQKPLSFDDQVHKRQKDIRLLRYESWGAEGFRPSGEFFYRSESQEGISEIAAVSETELLVLEGNGDIFHIDLDGAKDVSDAATLASPALEPLAKRHLVSVDACVPEDTDSSGQEAFSGTYEGMALGPALPSGRRLLMLVSDDNFDDAQVTRVVALSLQLERSAEKDPETCG